MITVDPYLRIYDTQSKLSNYIKDYKMPIKACRHSGWRFT